jgi:hypothetical protein
MNEPCWYLMNRQVLFLKTQICEPKVKQNGIVEKKKTKKKEIVSDFKISALIVSNNDIPTHATTRTKRNNSNQSCLYIKVFTPCDESSATFGIDLKRQLTDTWLLAWKLIIQMKWRHGMYLFKGSCGMIPGVDCMSVAGLCAMALSSFISGRHVMQNVE